MHIATRTRNTGNGTRNAQNFSLLGGREGGRDGTGLAAPLEKEALGTSWSQHGQRYLNRGAGSLRRRLGVSRLGRRLYVRPTKVQDCRLRASTLPLGIARVSGDPTVKGGARGQLHVTHQLPSIRTERKALSLPLSGQRGRGGLHTRCSHHMTPLSSCFRNSSSASGHCPGRPAGARNPGWG